MSRAPQNSVAVQSPPAGRVIFFANGVYSDHLAGGDIHLLYMAEAAVDAGYAVDFFGGHALQKKLETRFNRPYHITLTDKRALPPFDDSSLTGQLRLFFDYVGRLFRSLSKLSRVRPHDFAYATNDLWFETIPLLLCKTKRKLMVLGMDAPRLREIVFRTRPDVRPSRVASTHYWLSQSLCLRLFRFCRHKRLFYVHPEMKPRLLKMGYRESELIFISNGVDVKLADEVPPQLKEFDVIWVGRVHAQKGIEELLQTLSHLAAKVKGFRAVLVGKIEAALKPRLEELDLLKYVHFSGFVSEKEKYRLFKASHLFLMPSHYESWGIVIGEALACGTAVVAYDVSAYRPIFGDLVRYVQPFDFEEFKSAAVEEVMNARTGKTYLTGKDLSSFKAMHSWQAAQAKFQSGLAELNSAERGRPGVGD